MIELLFESLFDITDGFLVMDFMLNFCNNKWVHNKKSIIMALIFAVITFIVTKFYLFSHIELFIYMGYLYGCTKFFYKKPTKLRALFTSIFSILLVVFITSLVYMFFQLITEIDILEVTSGISILRIEIIIIQKIILFVIMRIILIFVSERREKFSLFGNIMIISFPIISIRLISALMDIGVCESIDNNEQNNVIILTIGIFVFNIFIYVYYIYMNKYTNDIINYKMQIEAIKSDKKRIEEGYEIYENIRILKHDIKSQLNCLEEYINHKNTDNLKLYIDNIKESINNTYNYIDTSNPILNYVINTRYNSARTKGIPFNVFINDCISENIEQVDLSSLLSNMLDNAIRASENEKDKEISLNIGHKSGYTYFIVKNKISKSVLKKNKYLKTTKLNKSEHGFGIRQIKNISEKYSGYMDINDNDNMFTVRVFLKS